MKSLAGTFKVMAAVLFTLSVLAFALRGFTTPLDLSSDTARDATAKNVLANREKTISQLEEAVKATVDDPKQAKTAQTAMLLLGQLRADEAVPLLLDHLTFMMPGRPHFITGIPLMKDLRPQVVALTDIGLPALPPLLAKRMGTDDPLIDALTYSVLIGTLGERVSVAYLQQAIDGQSDMTKRVRLIALRNEIARGRS